MTFEITVRPRSERQAIIEKALAASSRTDRLDDFRGEPIDLKVVSLELGLPVYRMANCRTFSEQQSTIAKKALDPSFFSKGQESSEAQAEQHEILRRITKNAKASIANIDEVLSLEGQRDPILITSTGVVVNGNRRLSAMRELFSAEPTKYAKFAHVKCSVLPSDASADDIDDVEAALQARPQTKLDYDWIGEAQLVRRQLQKGRSIDQVASQLRRKPAEIKNSLQALEEAELYLSEWAGKPGQYGLVSEDGEQLFKDIPRQISSQDSRMQAASRAIAWSVFENAEKFSGRVYNYNAAFGKLAPQIIQTVVEELGLELAATSPEEDGQFEFSIEEDDGALDYAPFVEALRNDETKDDALDALVDACVTAIERDKGKKRKDAALKSLGQVHSKLAAIDVSTAGQSTYPAMLKQIEAIGVLLAKLDADVRAASVTAKSGGSLSDDHT